MAKHTIEVTIEGKDKLSKAFDGIAKGALERVGQKLTNVASNLPQMAIEMVNLGAQAEATRNRFEKFAGSSDLAAQYLDAFQTATDGAASKMESMQGAAKLLQMGLVDNADEMKMVASIAVKLGDQTTAAGNRIGDFALMLANQSIPRLDNFGISSGKVRARIDELLKSGQALNREEAFKMATMEEGAKALEKLGDTSELTQTKIDKYKAAIEDAKLGFAEMITGVISGASEMDGYFGKVLSPDNIRKLPETASKIVTLGLAFDKAATAAFSLKNPMDAFQESIRAQYFASEQYLKDLEKLPQAEDGWRVSMQAGNVVTEESTKAAQEHFRATQALAENLVDAKNDAIEFADKMMMARERSKGLADVAKDAAAMEDFLRRMKERAVELGNTMLNLNMQWKGFFDRNKEQAADFAKKREEIEAKHQDTLAALTEKGQGKAIQINAAAEEEKLADLKYKLDLALMQQSEFSDKTKESTKVSKEHQIAELQEQVASQETLLDNYYNGRLVAQGQNISTELSAEQARYNEELSLLEAEMAKQQEAQRAAMGQMMLQSFEAWATMKGIPADKMLEMRTAIAEEYGLIDEETANAVKFMTSEWETWSTDFSASADDVIGKMGEVITTTGEIKTYLDALPDTWAFKVDIEGAGQLAATAKATGGQITIAQHGFEGMVGPGFGGPQMFLAGEAGPEFVQVTPGRPNVNNTVGSNNVYNIYDARAMQLVLSEQRREQRRALMKTM